MQQMQIATQHNGPDHLGLWLTFQCDCRINGSGALRCNGRGGGLQAAADDDWKNLSSWLDFKGQQSGEEDALWVSSDALQCLLPYL